MTVVEHTAEVDALLPSTPLDEARDWLRQRVDEGAECPCCTQFAKVYRRRIHATMASALAVAYAHGRREFTYLPDTLDHRQNADWAKLAHWGLIEPEEGARDDGSKRTGRWRVTDAGEEWVLGRSTVPTYARLYDGRCLGLVGDPVTVHDCLDSKFSYADLMGALAPELDVSAGSDSAASIYDPWEGR